MNALKFQKNTISIVILTAILIGAVFTGVANALNANAPLAFRTHLSNVRAYTPAPTPESVSYAVDGGVLFAGGLQGWSEIKTPDNVIVGAVAVDKNNAQMLYMGAANEMTIYRSTNAGVNWLRVPLNTEIVGGVTDIAVDSSQHLVYVGTDNAGVFRLRDVGSSMILSGHLLLDEPVLEVAADNTGAGLAFVRTAWKLYRAENFGLSWVNVDNLGSAPTALAITDGQPSTVYVGTADRGLVKSMDGHNWTLANAGLGMVAGSRLHIDALTTDPTQPNLLYVATSYLNGSTEVHQSPMGVSMSVDGAQSWLTLQSNPKTVIAELLPISGEAGAVYAVTNQSRTPVALGRAMLLAANTRSSALPTTTPAIAFDSSILAWVVAAMAAFALLFAIANDLRNRRTSANKPIAGGLVRHTR